MSKHNLLITIGIAFSLTTLNAQAGVPADYPKIKPGLWEIKVGKFPVRQCMDKATIAASEKQAAEYEKSAHCQYTYQKQASTYISDSTCQDKTSGLIKTHTETTQVNANTIKSVMKSTVNGKPMADMVNISTRLGDCTTAKAEGATDPNGHFVSFDDLIKQAQQSQHKKH